MGIAGEPQSFGPLTVPGNYRFDIYCDDDVSTNLTFQVEGSTPPYLEIQAIANGIAAPPANTNPGPEFVQTQAPVGATAYITWSADSVQEGSCAVSESSLPSGPPAVTWPQDYGFEPIQVIGGDTGAYTLTCIGNDGARYTVTETVQPSSDG